MYPKYYLADVPHELRTQVLDRCVRRLWHEALDLLHENKIYHYDRDDLINFYNWAPSTLPEPPVASAPPALPVEPESGQPPSAPLATDDGSLTTDHGQRTSDDVPSVPNPEPRTLNPEPETAEPPQTPQTPETPEAAPPEPAPPEPPAHIFKRRGKIAALPKPIREHVNVMLDEGSTYESIIEWLDQNGFPAVNKVNVHNWHYGGFRDWLREQERIENQAVQREWLGDIISRSQPGDLHHCIYTLFSSQIMDSLFGMDTAKLKSGLAAKPRDYIALMNGFRRLDKQLTDAPEFQKFLAWQREGKRDRNRPSPEAAFAILRELRLDHLIARARECEEFKEKVKPG